MAGQVIIMRQINGLWRAVSCGDARKWLTLSGPQLSPAGKSREGLLKGLVHRVA